MDCFLCWGVDFTVGVVEVGMGVKGVLLFWVLVLCFRICIVL